MPTPHAYAPPASASASWLLNDLAAKVSIPGARIALESSDSGHVATVRTSTGWLMTTRPMASPELASAALATMLRARFDDVSREHHSEAFAAACEASAEWKSARAACGATWDSKAARQLWLCERDMLTAWMAARATRMSDVGEIESGFAVNGTVAA